MDFEDESEVEEEEVEEMEEEEDVEEDEDMLLTKALFKIFYYILFFANNLLICCEMIPGFKHILNEYYILYHISDICHTVNSLIIFRVVFAIGFDTQLKYNYFGKTFTYLASILSVVSFVIYYVYLKDSRYSLDGQISADTRHTIQCTQLSITQIGLIGLISLKE